MNLKQLREAVGMTQKQVGDKMRITQSEVSRIEKKSDMRITTIQRYLSALGGVLEINVIKDNERTRII